MDVSQVRGRDSTGVLRVTKEYEYEYAKMVGPPNVLYDSRQYEHNIDKLDTCILAGHTRWKTVGDNSVKNAHPFVAGDIVGMHNGTLKSYHKLDGHDYRKTDSEVLFGHLSENGPQETFNKIEGAWACVWWDNANKTLNFIRNNERPLVFTWSKDLRTMYWASESWMFGAVACRAPLWDGGDDGKQFIALPEDTLWSFSINAKATKDEKPIIMKKALKILKKEEKRPLPLPGPSDRVGNWVKQNDGTYKRVVKNSDGTNTEETFTPAANRGRPPIEGGSTTGGSVTSPFVLERRRAAAERIKSLLNDPLPNELTAGGGTNSPLSNVSFLKNSAADLASTTRSTPSKESKKPILSLPGKTSKNQGLNNNDVPSVTIGLPLAESLGDLKSLPKDSSSPKAVSFRTILGILYITNNYTRDEYTAKDIVEKTDGKCCFCKEDYHSARNIGEIIDEATVICAPCLKTPDLNTIMIGMEGKD